MCVYVCVYVCVCVCVCVCRANVLVWSDCVEFLTKLADHAVGDLDTHRYCVLSVCVCVCK